MSTQKWDTSSLRFVIQHLRVPELFYPYELGNSDGLLEREKQTRQLLEACQLTNPSQEESLIKEVSKQFAEKGTYAQANNLAFLIDRTFDVWLRKNAFHSDLSDRLSKWRFLLFKLTLFAQRGQVEKGALAAMQGAVSTFITLLESISTYARHWEPLPKRSQSILLDQLTAVEKVFDQHAQFSEGFVDACLQNWQSFLDKQDAKVKKVSERFAISESKKNTSDYSLWLAAHYLNVLFNKRQLPNVLQRFLQEYWVMVVAKEIEKTLPADLSTKETIVVSAYHEDLDILCKNIVRVFCHRGESGFQLADQIIDDLQNMTQQSGFSAQNQFSELTQQQPSFFSINEAWEELSDCLLALLQGNGEGDFKRFTALIIPEQLVQAYGTTEQFKSNVTQFEDLNIKLNDWFILDDRENTKLLKLVANFEQSHQLLFSNYLGMKSAQFSYSEFKNRMENVAIKRLSKPVPMSSVFEQAINGLSKIAENQKRTRLVAAEKAKAEAERLLEDRRKADELATSRAEEIALRTRQLKAKREDKLRLEKEAVVLNIIRAFNLGAWIAIQEAGESQRFKLVVKLAATGKYVFVDRLGVKKREFKEAELMQRILSKEIEVLTDGAEFEDSLQRVVSRLRMSK